MIKKTKDPQYFDYICEWCTKKFKSRGRLRIKLCPSCKTEHYRQTMRERYAPKRTNENYYTLQKERNKKILAMYLDGDSAQFLADKFNLTKTRIYQILKMQGYSIV